MKWPASSSARAVFSCSLDRSLVALIRSSVFRRSLAKAGGVPPEYLSAAAGSITLLASIMVMANWGAAYDAIVMGGHRIDLTRTFNIATISGEAVAIITLLHMGYGLFAMASVMAASELVNLACCYFASRRILPANPRRPALLHTRLISRVIALRLQLPTGRRA